MDSIATPHLIPALVGSTITEFVTRDGHIFELSSGGQITSGGLWRLLLGGKIAATELDYEQSDWRPGAPPMKVQVRDQLLAHVVGKPILSARVTVPTGDLVIDLPDGSTLEFIKLHSFLESWQVSTRDLLLLVDAWGQVNQWGAA